MLGCRKVRWELNLVRAVRVGVLLCLLLVGLSSGIASGDAVGRFTWRPPVKVDAAAGLTVIDCRSLSLCVAADGLGDLVTSSDPAAGPAAWRAALVDTATCTVGGCAGSSRPSVVAISCPTTLFCAAVDDAGDVLTSSDPTGGASAWSATKIDAGNRLSGITCASVSFCVAADLAGAAIVTTAPMAGPEAWHAATIDSGPCTAPEALLCRQIGGLDERQLGAISCPSSSLCVTGDWFGNLLTSSDPTGGSSAWHVSYVDKDTVGVHAGSEPAPITGISCPSPVACFAIDESAGLLASQNPDGGAAAWKLTHAEAGTGGIGGGGFSSLTCPSTVLCAALYSPSAPPEVVLSTHPFSDQEWTRARMSSDPDLTGISCPTTRFCVASDSSGRVVVGHVPATPAQLRSLMRAHIAPSRNMLRIRAFLRSGSFSLSITMPNPGRLRVRWLLPRATGHASALLVARGEHLFAEDEEAPIVLGLSHAGRATLRHSKQARLIAEAIFTPSHGRPIRATHTFVLAR